jgi:spore coat polysaccharide biosynthesis protein SpsF
MLTAIIQARLGSTRFPGKILAEICGKPLIWHVVERLRWSKNIREIVLATTDNKGDDDLFGWAQDNQIKVFRGSEDDVLARYYYAACESNASVILRVTADDPFKDPDIIDNVYDLFQSKKLDFAYNNNPPTFPEGLDTEIFSFSAIRKAFNESADPYEREHVTQYFYRNPELFRQFNFSFSQDLSHLRWTIDNPEDFQMVTEIYNSLYKEGEIFKFQDILQLITVKPYLSEINKNVSRSAMYQNRQIK